MEYLQYILVFISGIIATLVSNRVMTTKNKNDAANELRDDLMKLFTEQTTRIDKLNAELLDLRYRNIELLDNLSKEKEAASQNRNENIALRQEIDNLKNDRARLANQIIALEDQIRQLKAIIAELQEHSVGYKNYATTRMD